MEPVRKRKPLTLAAGSASRRGRLEGFRGPQGRTGTLSEPVRWSAPSTLSEVAQRYTAWWRSAVDRWARNCATDEDVLLLNWLLDAGLIPNRVDSSAPSLVRERLATYRVVEKTISVPRTVNGLRDLDSGHDYRLNLRGEYDKLGPPVPRGYLEVLASSPAAAPIHDPRSGRRELADRVASPANPLTARVYVNRVWHWVFGTGWWPLPMISAASARNRRTPNSSIGLPTSLSGKGGQRSDWCVPRHDLCLSTERHGRAG